MNTNQTIQAVLQAERELAAAHLTLDLTRIDQLLHPNYTIIQPGGQIEGKAETLASLQGDTRTWEIANSDEMSAQLYGQTAIVTGRWRGKGQNGDEQFDYSARFLSVWVSENGRWRNVAYQATEMDG